jgi:hypothetical protein
MASNAVNNFQRAVWAGVAVNLLIAVPGIFFPHVVLGVFQLDPGSQDIWARFAAWLLILLSLFYLVPASDPLRMISVSWLAVLARMSGVVFFAAAVFILGESTRLLALGVIDGIFMVLEGSFLVGAINKQQKAPEAHT